MRRSEFCCDLVVEQRVPHCVQWHVRKDPGARQPSVCYRYLLLARLKGDVWWLLLQACQGCVLGSSYSVREAVHQWWWWWW